MQWATQRSNVNRKSKSRITPMRRRRTYLAALEALETRQLLSAGDSMANAIDLNQEHNLRLSNVFPSADSTFYYKITFSSEANLEILNFYYHPRLQVLADRNGDGLYDGPSDIIRNVIGANIREHVKSGTYYIKVSENQYVASHKYDIIIQSNAPTYGPLLTFTPWLQKGYQPSGNVPYNQFLPLDPVTQQRCVIGSSPVAAAQILEYWGYPGKISLSSLDTYTSTASDGTTINIPDDAVADQFPAFDTINNALSTIDYTDSSDRAYLAFALGIMGKANYSSAGTSSYWGADYFRRLGFMNAQDSPDWSLVKSTVISNLEAGMPVMLNIRPSAATTTLSHSLILDGYDPSSDQFHCVYGVGSQCDGLFTDDKIWVNVNGVICDTITGVTYNIQPPVAAPANPMVASSSTIACTLICWDTTLLATSYQVWRSTSSDLSTAVNVSNQSTTTFTDTSGRSYYYWIKAVNAYGSSAFSSALAALPNYTPLVTNLYRDVLGRAPDTAGLNNWIGSLRNGTTNATLIAAGFTGSVEYRTNRINEVYRAILNRDADQSGFNSWLNYLGTGHTLEQMKAGFYGSPEYLARRGGTNTTVVTAYYREILGRAPDAEGLAHWVTLLNGGSSATQVAYAIMSSSYEGAGLIVRRCYTTYLHRDPDAAGYQSWVNRILHGTSEIAIITGFLGSSEYAERA